VYRRAELRDKWDSYIAPHQRPKGQLKRDIHGDQDCASIFRIPPVRKAKDAEAERIFGPRNRLHCETRRESHGYFVSKKGRAQSAPQSQTAQVRAASHASCRFALKRPNKSITFGRGHLHGIRHCLLHGDADRYNWGASRRFDRFDGYDNGAYESQRGGVQCCFDHSDRNDYGSIGSYRHARRNYFCP
jgi:hypothetical protein